MMEKVKELEINENLEYLLASVFVSIELKDTAEESTSRLNIFL